MNMRMQLSEIHKQCDKSTSSSLLWCSARASIAPVVSQEHLASFNVRKLLQYRITGCKHLALKFLHWLKFKFTKPGFWSSIGMRSASVTDEHRLRFSTFSLVQVSVNTWKTNGFQRHNNWISAVKTYWHVTHSESMWGKSLIHQFQGLELRKIHVYDLQASFGCASEIETLANGEVGQNSRH